MKLFTKYNLINVISTVIIFLLGCVAFSLLLRYVIISQVDEDLGIEKNEIVTYVNQFNQLPAVVEVNDQYTVYKPVAQPGDQTTKIFTNEVYDKNEHEKELRRTIQFYIEAKNAWYIISVSKSLQGSDELIQSIILITVTLILLILAATFIINRIVLKKLWKPFYTTLQQMQQFNLSDADEINFDTPEIDEFSYLNSSLIKTLNRAQHDYQSLKEFTENASHELQTPLAVIQSKLDILIQNEKLSENESESIQSAYDALQGLSRLNQSLLLLAKIENRQFNEQEKIDIKTVIENKIKQFNELWKSRNITVLTSLSAKEIFANKYLIEILLNNLLSNATKHNITNGSIEILLNGNLQVINTGVAYVLDEKQLYKRFSKQNAVGESHGLGLSVVNEICKASKYYCIYNFQAPNVHSFTISW
ncbi:MAG: HAMP domain-containing sensor histidine kinase [Parafilimonas sp.]